MRNTILATTFMSAIAGFIVHPAEAATLTVGPGQQYTTIASAIAASHNGDTVNVFAGTYVNDYAEIGTTISLVAVGGTVKMVSQGYIPNGKGILITDVNVTITGFSFTGAQVTNNDGANGAGIRYQGGSLVLNNCYFANNQEGLLGNPSPTGTITVNNSEFYHNGMSTGPSAGYTHNIYVGDIAKFDAESSYFHGANVGHEIKSRAMNNVINNNRIVDGPTGTASYSIDLPNGGVATITNNQIEQGPDSQNPVIISYGEEGGLYSPSSLTVQSNLIENDLKSGSALGIQNDSSATAQVISNRVYGLTASQLVSGPANVSATQYLATEPVISNAHPSAK